MRALDPDSMVQVLRDLASLYDARAAVDEALGRAEGAVTGHAARAEVTTLALAHPAVRSVGLLASLSNGERSELVRSLVPDPDAARWTGQLVERILDRPHVHGALCRVLPASFAIRGHEHWELYRQWLRGLPLAPIWGEEDGVGIGQLYVPPRFTMEQRDEACQKGAEPVVHRDPLPALEALLAGDEGEPVFVLGGPGLGKSSLACMLAARLAASDGLQPVHVRLRELDPAKPLLDEVKRLLRAHGAAGGFDGVADHLTTAPRLTLLLDGFDELAAATHGSLTAFFFHVKDLQRSVRGLRVVLTGRDAIFTADDAAFPPGSHLYRLLPFDASEIGAWCANWRAVKGGAFDALPLAEKGSYLAEIAAQPLMLYMLAKMDEQGLAVSAEGIARQGRAGIYRRIIDWICRRHEQLRPEDPWKASHMRRFLRVAGYVAMVKGTEVVHLSDLALGLEAAGLAVSADERRYQAERTILAFAFHSPAHQAWEFTHKSFGEYLAAEYLAAVCHRLVEEGTDDLGQPVPRLSRQEGCREWLRAFGPAFVPDPVEEHLAPMLRGFPQFLGGGEADARVVERLRGRAGELVRSLLDESEAEEAVTVARAWGLRPTQVLGLALANAVAVAGLRFGDEGYRFDPETVAPGRFWELCRTVELAVRRTPGTALRTFSRMGVSTAALDPHGGVGWHGAFLPFVRLRGPLTVALRGAFLQGCDLESVVAQGVDLGGAMLAVANLRGADLQGAFLQAARLTDASLEGADLRLADLRGVRADGARLRGADLRRAVLRGGDLTNASLREAKAAGADLRAADLSDADLRGTWLAGADLRAAKLAGADLEGAHLESADLRVATLTGADLRGARLASADLRGADLRGAKLDPGALRGALTGEDTRTDPAAEDGPAPGARPASPRTARRRTRTSRSSD